MCAKWLYSWWKTHKLRPFSYTVEGIKSIVHVSKKVLLSHCHSYNNNTDFYRSSHECIFSSFEKYRRLPTAWPTVVTQMVKHNQLTSLSDDDQQKATQTLKSTSRVTCIHCIKNYTKYSKSSCTLFFFFFFVIACETWMSPCVVLTVHISTIKD